MGEQIKSTEQKLEAIETRLNEILAEKRLDFTVNDNEINEIFDLGLEKLSKMPYNKLSEYAFVLAKYNVFIQRDLNKEKVVCNWAKRSIDYLVLPKLSEYRIPGSYMSNEEVKMIAIKNNDVAIKLNKLVAEREQYITLLSDLGLDIRKMSDYLLEISKSKRFNNG